MTEARRCPDLHVPGVPIHDPRGPGRPQEGLALLLSQPGRRPRRARARDRRRPRPGRGAGRQGRAPGSSPPTSCRRPSRPSASTRSPTASRSTCAGATATRRCRGERFDLICTNPPQMPTPPGRERRDPTALADNGGVDGWSILDRVIAGAPEHLAPGRASRLHHLWLPGARLGVRPAAGAGVDALGGRDRDAVVASANRLRAARPHPRPRYRGHAARRRHAGESVQRLVIQGRAR